MQPTEEDAAYLWDRLDAARAVVHFTSGLSLDQHLNEELVQSAVERKIEIIGEAARKVSVDFRDAHTEVPWAKITGQRHVLAHDYGKIQHDRIWNVVDVHIPELIAQLEAILPPEPSQEN